MNGECQVSARGETNEEEEEVGDNIRGAKETFIIRDAYFLSAPCWKACECHAVLKGPETLFHSPN